MRIRVILLGLCLLLHGIVASAETFPCRIVLEEVQGVRAESYVAETQPGGTISFVLRVDPAYTVNGCDYEGALLTRNTDGSLVLTLPDVRYSEAVRLSVARNELCLVYHANGGSRVDGGDPEETIAMPAAPTHLRLNTSNGYDLFTREGYTLTGWNSAADGSGIAVGLGSRVAPEDGLILYAQWSAWEAETSFLWEPYGDGVRITAWLGSGTGDEVGKDDTSPLAGAVCVPERDVPELSGPQLYGEDISAPAAASLGTSAVCALGESTQAVQQADTDSPSSELALTIPAELGSLPVRGIAAGAFAGAICKRVILPNTMWSIADGAFTCSTLESLCLFDSIRELSDYAFEDCPQLKTLHINAALPPVYSGSYYATFADKFDRLWSLRDERKLVLFSGSSTRFGYDSAALDEAFPEFGIVNMGVFAYTNALPQLELIRLCMQPGDVLLHSPEFDAIQRQFCTNNRLDAPFFNMMEANYDMVSLLDLRAYGQIFTALHTFLKSRDGMEARGYALSPSEFDEDGKSSATPSYNEYGDYVLYRPNTSDDAPIYGLPVDYTTAGYPRSFLDSANAEYRRFLADGVRVCITYAPRNRLAISEASTPEARAALDAYLRKNLCVPIISDIEDSLFSGNYLSGTDNHLSTQGVAIRTQRITDDLRSWFALEDGQSD